LALRRWSRSRTQTLKSCSIFDF